MTPSGHLDKTIYPDGAFETSGYDAEGRRIESIDRAGRKTAYTYDALGRLTLTSVCGWYDAIPPSMIRQGK